MSESSSIEIKSPKRVFVFNKQEIEDPNPDFSPHEILELLAINHSELLNAKLTDPELSEDGEKLIYELKVTVEQHG